MQIFDAAVITPIAPKAPKAPKAFKGETHRRCVLFLILYSLFPAAWREVLVEEPYTDGAGHIRIRNIYRAVPALMLMKVFRFQRWRAAVKTDAASTGMPSERLSFTGLTVALNIRQHMATGGVVFSTKERNADE